jgi:serine/threonine-protein kinase ULK2
MNEIAILSQINSPNVVRLKDSTRTSSNFYLALELCNGGDLNTFVRARGGSLSEQETRIVFRRVVQGMAAIKEQDVVHRDLKLENIMLHFSELRSNVCADKNFNMAEYIRAFDFRQHHQSMRVKIADLGFARKLQANELAVTQIGTPLNMAPEIVFGYEYCHKADVWSLGCLFYQMLTGYQPFMA